MGSQPDNPMRRRFEDFENRRANVTLFGFGHLDTNSYASKATVDESNPSLIVAPNRCTRIGRPVEDQFELDFGRGCSHLVKIGLHRFNDVGFAYGSQNRNRSLGSTR